MTQLTPEQVAKRLAEQRDNRSVKQKIDDAMRRKMNAAREIENRNIEKGAN